jgi:hypothetical protein
MGYTPPHKENIIWVKIDNDVFDVIDVTVQLSIGSHTTTYISLDINKNPNYLKYFTNLYENHSSFTMSSIKFVAPGSLIKSIDVDFDSNMNLTIKSDIFNPVSIQERREEIIDELLNNKTSENKTI